MKRIGILLIMLVFMSCPAVRAEEITLTLNEAVDIALRDNRDVLLKTEDVKKSKEKIAEANAALFPTVNFTAARSDTRGYYTKDLDQTTTQTTVKQYLYKGGKTINTIEQNKNKVTVSEALLDKAKLETVLNVKKAFYTLLLAADYANLNKWILGNTRAHLNFIQARYEGGQASESEVLKIKDSLDNVAKVYEDSLNQVESSRILLATLLFLDQEVRIKPDAKFNYEPAEVAYDEAFLKAMEKRPEIRQYEAQEKADKKAIEIAKADNRPSIYASWDYYSRSVQVVGTTTEKNWNDYNVIGVTFTWPIFDGWAAKAKVEQAIVDLKETQLTKEKTLKDIALELKSAYLGLKNAIAKIKAAQADADLYKDIFLVTKDRYKAGMASSLELNDSALGFEVSLFNKKQAGYDYVLTKAQFDKAMGEEIR